MADEYQRALLPVARAHRSPHTRNLIRRIQRGFATPHIHAHECMVAKHDGGEPFENGIAFPVSLIAQARRIWNKVEAPYEDHATIAEAETALEGQLNVLQTQLAFCLTPGLIRNALDLIAKYRRALDAYEEFLRARLEQLSLRVVR